MGWSTRSSLTIQDPRDADSGVRLQRRAGLLGSLSANRMFGNFRFGGDLAYTGELSHRGQHTYHGYPTKGRPTKPLETFDKEPTPKNRRS